MRFEFREILAPRILLQEPYHSFTEEDLTAEGSERQQQRVRWELVLATDHARSMLTDRNQELWNIVLPELIEDLQLLVRDALDLKSMLGDASPLSDRSYWDFPSISEHRQNRRTKDWALLAELLRDAWLSILSLDRFRATQIAQSWYRQPYPLFKRMAFFAASHESVIPPDQWIDWLAADDSHWIWSPETGREVFRLLVLQGNTPCAAEREQLEKSILAGPDRGLYEHRFTPERVDQYLDRIVWLALSKLYASGLKPGDEASERLKELQNKYPRWTLAIDECDEFSFWVGDVNDTDNGVKHQADPVPERWQDMVTWLKEHPGDEQYLVESGWREACETLFDQSLKALQTLFNEGVIPEQRWQEALQAWSRDHLHKQSWDDAAPLVCSLPDDILEQLGRSVSWWIEVCSKTMDKHADCFRELCRRLLAIPFEAHAGILNEGEAVKDPVSEAINHPVGHVTQAIIHELFRDDVPDNHKLPDWIEAAFTEICRNQHDRFRLGRVILAAHLIALFRVDPIWAKSNLLPHFSWDNKDAAQAAWEGFLWSPRLFKPLFDAFKDDF